MLLTLGRLGVCAAFYKINFNLGSYCGITPNRLLPAVKINFMTTQNFIDEHKTATLKKGDKVIMDGCYEASFEENKNKVWICQTDSYMDRAKQEVVFLEGFSGCFAVQYLKPVVS